MKAVKKRHGLGLAAGLAFLTFGCLDPSLVYSQRPPTPPINFSDLRFDFILTGARRAALGGAFIGAAQDETAGFINPAGLTYLRRAGASLHFRLLNVDDRFDSDQFVAAAFFPVKSFAFAFAREHWFNTRFDFETEQQLTIPATPSVREALGGLGNFPGRRVFMDLQLILERFSLAYQISRRLSLGVTASNVTLEINHSEQTFLDPLVIDGSSPRGNLAETNYSNTTLDRRDGLRWGLSFGLLAAVIPDKLFFGSVIDFNPSFELTSNIFLPQYTVASQTFPAQAPEDKHVTFSVPDSYGFGLYYRANKRLNFTLDVLRREYTDLLEGNDLNVAADDQFSEQNGRYEDPDGRPDLIVDDATEVHVGLEWLFKAFKVGLIPLRFGLFTSPGHRIYTTNADPNLRKLYPQAEDRVHVTLGIGVVGRSYYKYDVAADLSQDGWQLFFSATFTVPEM